MSTSPYAPPPYGQPPLDLPPPSPQHPAPTDGWRPLSGLCLSAFILALALSLLSLISLWAGLLLPLALGLVALAVVDRTRYRGRALAWWAVGISVVFGGLGLTSTRMLNTRVGFFTNGFVASLRSERPDEERRAAIEAWIESATTRAATYERVESRWRQALERLGPLTGPAILPSIWAGQFPLMVPPSGVVAIDDPANPGALPAPGGVLWARLPFQRGEAHLALWVGDGSATGLTEALEKLADERAVPIVRDARFFAKPALLDPAAPAPTER